jgi:hypothetical protein
MAIFKISPAIPKRNRAINNPKELGEYPKMGMINMYITIAVKHIHLDSYFVINQPASGNEMRDPIGNPNKIVPNSESVKCNFSLKSGILVAQLAKLIPQRKNSKLMDALFLNIKIDYNKRLATASHVSTRWYSCMCKLCGAVNRRGVPLKVFKFFS